MIMNGSSGVFGKIVENGDFHFQSAIDYCSFVTAQLSLATSIPGQIINYQNKV